MYSTKKDNEPAIAAYRILTALVILQKQCTENAFHLQRIREQVQADSKDPASNFGRLGRGWVRSFDKAIDRMARARIIEHITLETVAITEHATMVLSNSAHITSIPNSSSPDDNHYWKELIGFSRGEPPLNLHLKQTLADKRSISEYGFPNKRVKVSHQTKKQVTQSEAPKQKNKGKDPQTLKKRGRPKKIQPQLELEGRADEQSHLQQWKRPLPDLGDDEVEVDIEHEEDDESENHDHNESEEEGDYSPRISSASRGETSHCFNNEENGLKSPSNAVASSSRPRPILPKPKTPLFYEGVLNLQSGSYTPNSGKHIPNPYPKSRPRSPVREAYVNDTIEDVAIPQLHNNNIDVDSAGRTRRPHLSPTLPEQRRTNNHTTHNNNNNNNVYQSPGLDDRAAPRYTQASVPSNTPNRSGNLHIPNDARTQTNSHSEIKSPRIPPGESAAAGGSRAISTPEGATGLSLSIYQVDKMIGYGDNTSPDHWARLESIVAHQEKTKFALEEANEKLRAELSELHLSCERTEKTVVRTRQQLLDARGDVDGLKRERAYTLGRLREVKKMSQDARTERDALAQEVRSMKEREAELESTNRRLEGRMNNLLRELDEMKLASLERDEEESPSSPNDSMNDIDSNDLSHAVLRRNDDDDDDMDRTPTKSKSRAEVNERGGVAIGVQRLGNQSDSRDPRVDPPRVSSGSRQQEVRNLGKPAESRLSARQTRGTGATHLTSRSFSQDDGVLGSNLGAETFEATLETSVDNEMIQTERPEQLLNTIVVKQLENGGKREMEILTVLREKITDLMNTLAKQEKDNQLLTDGAQATRALLIELEQTNRDQLSARSSSHFDGALRSAKADLDDVGARLAHGDAERKGIRLQLEKTKGGMDNLGDLLGAERKQNATLAAQLEESMVKTRSLEDELLHYTGSKVIRDEDIELLKNSLDGFRQRQLKSLKELEAKFKGHSST